MKTKWKLALAVAGLALAGGGVAIYKVNHLGVPFWHGERVEEWLVEARVSFVATGGRTKARLALPANAINAGMGQEAGSLGYSYFVEKEAGEYTAVWAAESRKERQALYYRVRFPTDTSGGAEPLSSSGMPKADEPVSLPGSAEEGAVALVARVKALSADPDGLVVALFEHLRSEQGSQELTLVKRHYEKAYQQEWLLEMGIDLLNRAGVPARVAYGVVLDAEAGPRPPVPLIEYYDGSYWRVRDPLEPATVVDGSRTFVWHRGGGPLLDVTGGKNSRVVFTVVKDRIPLERLTDLRTSPFLISTILGLPASERSGFHYIVLIPLGAFVVVVMRNLIGVPTLGTFMPVLLALAFLEMPLVSGLSMFSILIAVGLWFRFLLSRLNLLVVPRVAACVVIVTLLMVLMSVASFKLDMGVGMRITLFPMIILAWTIERMSLIWEEEGRHSALIQVAGSLGVAVLAYRFMRISQIQYWALYFPELLLILLAGILLIGRYTGYRFSELFRFKSFARG